MSIKQYIKRIVRLFGIVGEKPKLPRYMQTAGLRACKGGDRWDPDSGLSNRTLAVGDPIFLTPDAIGHEGTRGPIMENIERHTRRTKMIVATTT
jgi:hypothetical protein